jgi:hypothetical protein
MKVGDIVICKDNYFVKDISYQNVYSCIAFMKGCEYDIVGISNNFYDIYSITMKRSYSIDRKRLGRWFLTKSEIRRQKLEKLDSIV